MRKDKVSSLYQQIEALDVLKLLPAKNSIIDTPIMEIFEIQMYVKLREKTPAGWQAIINLTGLGRFIRLTVFYKFLVLARRRA